MKYCTHCGKELLDEAVICVGCGCAVNDQYARSAKTAHIDKEAIINTLEQRINTNGIIWLVIGILQIVGGIFINWYLLIVGALNIVSSVQDMNNSKKLAEDPAGIAQKYKQLTGPIIALVYNVLIGGIIGVVGSIYYFFAIRSYILENELYFEMAE